MKLSAPTKITWFVTLALFVLGLIGALFTIPVLTGLAPWLALVGLALLLVATYTAKL
jgi:hypothetical protein